jgi:hypothetical protein
MSELGIFSPRLALAASRGKAALWLCALTVGLALASGWAGGEEREIPAPFLVAITAE